MAHEVESMAYAGDLPWHGLGVKVGDDLKPDEILKAAGLDWSVRSVPSLFKIDGAEYPTGDHSLIRVGKDGEQPVALSTISEGWHPVQNQEAFEVFSDVVKAGGMKMHTAGSLRDGKVVWALAKMTDHFALFNKRDEIESFCLLVNPHEYGKSVIGTMTAIRVVCMNTLRAALAKKGDVEVKLHHRQKFDAEKVKQLLQISSENMAKYKEVAEFLAGKKYTPQKLLEYANAVFPHTGAANENTKSKIIRLDDLSRPAAAVFAAAETSPGSEMAKGTWWNAFNGVTYLTDHRLGHSAETRLNSAWFGQNKERKSKALDLAVQFAKSA